MIKVWTGRGSPAWYTAMTERQLQRSLRGLQEDNLERPVIERVLAERRERRRELRKFRLKVAGVMLLAIAGAVAVMALL